MNIKADPAAFLESLKKAERAAKRSVKRKDAPSSDGGFTLPDDLGKACR